MGIVRTGPSGETIDTSRHRALASTSRVAILQLVRRSDAGLTASEVAVATGLHLTTIREHLDQLAEARLLTRERRSDGSPGRPAWRYRAGPVAPDPARGPYRELAEALVEHLARTADDPYAAGVSAGRAWGRKLASGAPRTGGVTPAAGLVMVLDKLGFSPQLAERSSTEAATVHLRNCPFLDLVASSPDVVCGLHLGVIRGALGAMGAPGSGATLEPFATPTACVVRLHPSPIKELEVE